MKDNYRKTDFYFSTLIENLYGTKDHKKIKSYNNITSAKKFYLKIIKSINFAIEETLTLTDRIHKKELCRTIRDTESSVKESKSINELDQRMIAFQSEIIFLLIGFFPRRLGTDKIINKRNQWKLDLYRQIQYTQTIDQKKNLIFKAVQGKYQSRFGSWSDFVTKVYSRQCKSNPEILIEWVKKNHSDIYLELF
jgi:methionine synthase II (cobalamin-independent)